jgi:hypothetical protein
MLSNKKPKVIQIVKVPAVEKRGATNRIPLIKAKVPEPAQGIRIPRVRNRMKPKVRIVPRAKALERVRALRKVKVPAAEQVPIRAELMHSIRAADKMGTLVPKPDFECSRQSSGPCRSRFHS